MNCELPTQPPPAAGQPRSSSSAQVRRRCKDHETARSVLDRAARSADRTLRLFRASGLLVVRWQAAASAEAAVCPQLARMRVAAFSNSAGYMAVIGTNTESLKL